MNEEPTWLRGDAAARAKDSEHESEVAPPVRRRTGGQHDARLASDAARALSAGRPEAVQPAAMLHLQRAAGNAGVASALDGDQEGASPVKDVVGKGGGSPLEAPVRQRMEASFGADFSDVRVHAGGPAASSARAIDARAYTVGNEIVLGEGEGPGAPGHEHTLAHELSHVVQQREGPVDGTPAGGGISVSSPSDRFERAADTTADAVLATGRAPDAGTAAGAPARAQREQGADEVQGLWAQRRQEPEEEVEEPNRPSAPTGEAPAAEGTPGPAAEAAPPAQSGAETAEAAASPAQAGAAEAAASPAQAGAAEAAAPSAQAGGEGMEELAPPDQSGEEPADEEEREEVQELAIQRLARPAERSAR